MTNKVKTILLSIVIAATFISSGVMIWRYVTVIGAASATNGSGNNSTQGNKLFDVGKYSWIKEKVVVTTQILQDGIQEMGLLITESYYFTQKETYEKKTSAGFLVSTATVTYSYDGTVYAGIEFGEITVEKDDLHKIIYITLPKAKITSISIDRDSFKQYEEKQGWWSKITMADLNKSMIQYEENAKAAAIEKGVLHSADDKAEEIIRNFVVSMMEDDSFSFVFYHK